jgi:hypothetical protein
MPPVDGNGNGRPDRSTPISPLPTADTHRLSSDAPVNNDESLPSEPSTPSSPHSSTETNPPISGERAPSSTYHSSSPVSLRSLLPPRLFNIYDSNALQRDKVKEPTLNPYQNLLKDLVNLARWIPEKGYSYKFSAGKIVYEISQQDPEGPIEISAFQSPKMPPESPSKITKIIKMSFLPDGMILNDSDPTPHSSLSSVENSHFSVANTFLNHRLQGLKKGIELHALLKTSLKALKGRPAPESQSVWYDNFVVREGKIYSFQIQNVSEFLDFKQEPEVDQISIYEETITKSGAQRTLLATLSATGEIGYQSQQNQREPLNEALRRQLEGLVPHLQQATEVPATYQSKLEKALGKISISHQVQTPKIQLSTDISTALESETGRYGEPIFQIDSGWKLLSKFHPWATHQWKNPDKPGEVRRLSPRLRMSYHMGRELSLWIGKSLRHFFFRFLKDPKPREDFLRLRLFPNGGGEIAIYRKGEIFDHIIGGASGPLWRAREDPTIRRLNWKALSGEERIKTMREAYARRGSDATFPAGTQISVAPTINMDECFLNPDGTPKVILDAQTAWDLIQQQIPEGTDPIVHSDINLQNKMTSLEAIFHNTQPSLLLRINQSSVSTANTNVPRVEIILRRGHDDTHVRVFQDGRFKSEESQDVLGQTNRHVMEGRVDRNFFSMLGHGYLRRGAYSLVSGTQYLGAHFLSLPFILGYEHLLYTPAEKKLIGTPKPKLNWNSLGRPLINFTEMAFVFGVQTVTIDGLYNLKPGLGQVYTKWKTSTATFMEAYRTSNLKFFNPYPTSRPIGNYFWFRGLLQRAYPLFLGLATMEYLETKKIDRAHLLHNFRDVGLVSLGSAALMRGVYFSDHLAGLGMRAGLMEASSLGTGAARYSLTFRGGLILSALEFIALGIINAHERRAAMKEVHNSLRTVMGNALDRRNELITRLESGETIAPSQILSADQELHEAQGIYRRFLELSEHFSGSGHYEKLSEANNFQDEYDHYGQMRTGILQTASGPQAELQLNRLEMEHHQRLVMLHKPYETMERELNELYSRYGFDKEKNQKSEEGLGQFLNRQIQLLRQNPSTQVPTATPNSTHVDIQSPEAKAILEQFRWKAAKDPSFVLLDNKHKARYLLQQFRGYQIQDSDGTRRPWTMNDALAFLGEVQNAEIKRSQNMEESLTIPQENEGYDTSRLQALMTEEEAIRKREKSSRIHVGEHGKILADNVADFDQQMAEYYQRTNERTARALEKFIEPSLLAAR